VNWNKSLAEFFVIKPMVVPKIIDGPIDIEPSSNTGKDVPGRNPEFGG